MTRRENPLAARSLARMRPAVQTPPMTVTPPPAMAFLPLRSLDPRPAESLMQQWLERLSHELADPSTDRPELCRRTLTELSYPQYAANWETAVHDETIPIGTRLALAALDP